MRNNLSGHQVNVGTDGLQIYRVGRIVLQMLMSFAVMLSEYKVVVHNDAGVNTISDSLLRLLTRFLQVSPSLQDLDTILPGLLGYLWEVFAHIQRRSPLFSFLLFLCSKLFTVIKEGMTFIISFVRNPALYFIII